MEKDMLALPYSLDLRHTWLCDAGSESGASEEGATAQLRQAWRYVHFIGHCMWLSAFPLIDHVALSWQLNIP